MKSENTIKTAIGLFLIIVLGSLLSAVLGGLFGILIATVSPEFTKSIFNSDAETALLRYSFSVGMLWGLFGGAAVSGFSCFLAAIIKILKVHLE